MWKRFVRWVRSVLGGAVDSLENPEKILQQNIRDMNDQIPAMNQNIAMIKANANLSRVSLEKLQAKSRDLIGSIKHALKAGRRDPAMNFATTLEQVQVDITVAEGNLELAEKSLEKALKVKEAFLADRNLKIKEALRAIQQARQAEWQEKVALAMESFEVAGMDQTHHEMIRKVEEKVARAQARLEMAVDSDAAEGIRLEKEMLRWEANETLRRFEIELGISLPEGAPVKGALAPPEEKAPEPVSVTIKDASKEERSS